MNPKRLPRAVLLAAAFLTTATSCSPTRRTPQALHDAQYYLDQEHQRWMRTHFPDHPHTLPEPTFPPCSTSSSSPSSP